MQAPAPDSAPAPQASPPSHDPWALAIETSGRLGGIALSRLPAAAADRLEPRALADRPEILDSRQLTHLRRHNVELMPAIDAACREHGLRPTDLALIAVSQGPGSFTGLRSGISVAKMLAWASHAGLVAVPTMDIVARLALADPAIAGPVLVTMHHKRGELYAGGFSLNDDGSTDPWLPRGLFLESDLPAVDPNGRPVQRVSDETHPPTAVATLNLGVGLARDGRFADPASLAPLYVRIPEAVEQWERRKAACSEPAGPG